MEGAQKKPIHREDCLKRWGTWTVFRFKEGLGENEGVVYFLFFEREGGDTPMHMDIAIIRKKYLKIL